MFFFYYYLYSISVTSRFNPDLPHLIPNQNMVNKEKLEAEEEMCFLREQNRTRCFSRILTLLLFVTWTHTTYRAKDEDLIDYIEEGLLEV